MFSCAKPYFLVKICDSIKFHSYIQPKCYSAQLYWWISIRGRSLSKSHHCTLGLRESHHQQTCTATLVLSSTCECLGSILAKLVQTRIVLMFHILRDHRMSGSVSLKDIWGNVLFYCLYQLWVIFVNTRFLVTENVTQCKKYIENHNTTESIVCTVRFKFHEYKNT